MFLCEGGFFGQMQGPYEQALGHVLNQAYKDFMDWNRSQETSVTHPRFTPARLNRKTRLTFPSLSSKGAASKALTFWLAGKMEQLGSAPGATPLEKEVASCVIAYSEFLRACDRHGMLLSASEAKQLYDLGMLHLLTYSSLRHRSSRTLGFQACNKQLWLLLPKHHHFLHLLTDTISRDRLNPRFQTLFAGESFVGHIGRMAKSCHRASLSRRLLQRYCIRFGMMQQGLE